MFDTNSTKVAFGVLVNVVPFSVPVLLALAALGDSAVIVSLPLATTIVADCCCS